MLEFTVLRLITLDGDESSKYCPGDLKGHYQVHLHMSFAEMRRNDDDGIADQIRAITPAIVMSLRDAWDREVKADPASTKPERKETGP